MEFTIEQQFELKRVKDMVQKCDRVALERLVVEYAMLTYRTQNIARKLIKADISGEFISIEPN